jgi:hypothetical protein
VTPYESAAPEALHQPVKALNRNVVLAGRKKPFLNEEEGFLGEGAFR